MPNWCVNYISIKNENEEELKRLEALIDECTASERIPTDFGPKWLGNIVIGAELDTWNEETHNFENNTRCRGRLESMEVQENCLDIQTETAWGPMMRMWLKLLEKYSPESELQFTAVETGMGVYMTTEDMYLGRYYIDSIRTGVEPDMEATEDDVRKVIQELCETDETDIDKLMSTFEGMGFDDVWIHKWETPNIEDCL